MAAIYFCRAAFEVLVNRTKDGEIKYDFEALFSEAEASVRYFNLIEAARIQDFHRNAIRFGRGFVTMAGPISLKTSSQAGSSVAAAVKEDGERVELKKRNASIKYNRPLQIHEFSFYDEDAQKLVDVPTVICDHLTNLSMFVDAKRKKENA